MKRPDTRSVATGTAAIAAVVAVAAMASLSAARRRIRRRLAGDPQAQ